ncbi:hypothetical protein HMPREF1211_05352 [Streptomyces sp. HGB0020]|jgi:hypothetical protein|nr:hypothetical protein HMPREF1211_05352 [Streptomyces sp. HGB0020]
MNIAHLCIGLGVTVVACLVAKFGGAALRNRR